MRAGYIVACETALQLVLTLIVQDELLDDGFVREHQPVFGYTAFGVQRVFDLGILFGTAFGNDFDDPVRCTVAPLFVEFVRIADDADVGLDNGKYVFTGQDGFPPVVQANIKRGRKYVASLMFKMQEHMAAQVNR